MYLVQLANASSPSGVAYIGPCLADGFKTESPTEAYHFNTEFEANQLRDHWAGYWRGFHGGADLRVVPA